MVGRQDSSPGGLRGIPRPPSRASGEAWADLLAALLRLYVVELQEVEELTDLMVELGRMPHSHASV